MLITPNWRPCPLNTTMLMTLVATIGVAAATQQISIPTGSESTRRYPFDAGLLTIGTRESQVCLTVAEGTDQVVRYRLEAAVARTAQSRSDPGKSSGGPR